MNKFDLSIIILSWNTKKLLENCLTSLDKNTDHQIKTEVIIIDNNSKDNSKKFIKSFNFSSKNIEKKTIFNNQNLGFAKANNQGIKIAQGKYIFLLNSDTETEKKAIKKLVSFLDNHQETSAVSPMLLNPDGSRQMQYYMKFPNFWQMVLFHNIVLRFLAMQFEFKKLLFQSGKNKPFEVDQLPGAALMARRQTFDQIGLLDEGFTFLFEDVDWCYRAKQKKGKLVVVPDSKIMHVGGASWKQTLKANRFKFYKKYFGGLFRFVQKHYPYKELPFKIGLSLSFLSNTLAHLLTFQVKKAQTQLRLLIMLF